MAESKPGAAGRDWDEIQRVFLEVRQLPPAERSRRLDSACAGDGAKRSLLGELLHHSETPAPDWMRPRNGTALTADHPADSLRSEPEPIEGFEIRSLIGCGAMGDVYEAMQGNPHRIVALKIMKPGFDMRRFKQESEMLGHLRHPGIARVHVAGVQEGRNGPIPYFAMEYIPAARTLTQYADEWKLPVRERLELFARICDAIQDAHQRGIVHRDLKPGNILVDGEGNPKIIDFGVAWAANNVTAERRGQVCGTWTYMSPEQLDGDPHDMNPRSDVYTLGVVLYELLCERLPYSDTTFGAIRTEQPVPPSAHNADLDADLDRIILRALQKRRSHRYRNAAELGDALRRYLDSESVVPPSPGPSTTSSPTPSDGERPGIRIVAIYVSISLVVLVAGLLIPWFYVNSHHAVLDLEAAVTVRLEDSESSLGPASDGAVGDIDPWLVADRAGVFYVFRLGRGRVGLMECDEPHQCLPYTPGGEVFAGCVYPEVTDLPGHYCVFAILLSGRDDHVCDLIEHDTDLAAVAPQDQHTVMIEVMRILRGREDLLGYGASTYARR